MALAAAVARETRGFTIHDPEAQNTAQIYAGSYCAGGNENHATAAKIGYAYPFNDEDGAIPLGFAKESVLGTAVAPRPRAYLHVAGRVVENLAVTGLAGDNTDRWKLVYATDDNTFTFTRTTPNLPVGFVVDFVSATLAHVYFFSMAELAILALAGGQRKTTLLAQISGVSGGGGTFLTGWAAPCHGRILSTYGIVIEPLVTAGADLDVNLEIGGTNVTGGVIEWLLANAAGTKKAGTAITALNVFHEGDLIDIEITENSASSAGQMAIYIDWEPLLGL